MNALKTIVRAAQVGTHGVAAARLKGHGVGPLAPIAPNGMEDGRAKNRRVELVKRQALHTGRAVAPRRTPGPARRTAETGARTTGRSAA